MSREKYRSYLLLFGLEDNFTQDDLRSSFATLARLNHPDVSDSPESQMRMAIINEAYAFLKSCQRPDTPASVSDPAYERYRRGYTIMKMAFEDYYGESPNKKKAGDSNALKERLAEAKNEFAELVKNMSYGEWTSDAIDRICSINKWLD